MHNPLKFAAAAIAAALLTGCSGEGIKVGVVEKSYEAGSSAVQAKLPQFEYAPNPDFAESLNSEYDTLVMTLLDEFIARTQDSAEKSEFKLESDVKMNNGKLISVVCEGETFTGGAHGEKFRISKTVDFENGNTLTLADIFADEGWKTAVDARMEQMVQSGDEQYRDLWEKPSTKLLKEENFYTNNEGIVFYFPPYELSYYRRGFVEFEFGYTELSGFLSDGFKSLIE